MSPYRTPGARPRDDDREGAHPNAEVGVVAGVLWVACLARSAWAFARHETFAAEATLALLVAVLGPALLVRKLSRR
jgi:hypothetical protein